MLCNIKITSNCRENAIKTNKVGDEDGETAVLFLALQLASYRHIRRDSGIHTCVLYLLSFLALALRLAVCFVPHTNV
jgi:hypothetical protein